MTENRSPFAEILSQHRLLVILRTLQRAPGYGANDEVLDVWLEAVGLSGPRAMLAGDLRRLEELGCCTLKRVADLTIATLTEHGADVAEGKVVIAEVLRPRPGCPY